MNEKILTDDEKREEKGKEGGGGGIRIRQGYRTVLQELMHYYGEVLEYSVAEKEMEVVGFSTVSL